MCWLGDVAEVLLRVWTSTPNFYASLYVRGFKWPSHGLSYLAGEPNLECLCPPQCRHFFCLHAHLLTDYKTEYFRCLIQRCCAWRCPSRASPPHWFTGAHATDRELRYCFLSHQASRREAWRENSITLSALLLLSFSSFFPCIPTLNQLTVITGPPQAASFCWLCCFILIIMLTQREALRCVRNQVITVY